MPLPKTYETRWYSGRPLPQGGHEGQRFKPRSVVAFTLVPLDEEEPKAGFSPDPFEVAQERIKRAQVEDAALQFQGAKRTLDKQADRFLKAHGMRLKGARGGSILK